MHEMSWYGPDGWRYQVSVVQEPFDRRQTVVFRCDERGWTGVASTMVERDLSDLSSDELGRLLGRAKLVVR